MISANKFDMVLPDIFNGFLSMYIVFSIKIDESQVFKKNFNSYSVFLSTLQTIA